MKLIRKYKLEFNFMVEIIIVFLLSLIIANLLF